MKRILSFVLATLLFCSLCVASVGASEENTLAYDDTVLRQHIADYIEYRADNFDYYEYFESTYDEVEYDVVYSHYTEGVATPDYVLVNVNFVENSKPETGVIIDDYVITNTAWYNYNPFFITGYFVIIPDTGKVYTLEDAFSKQVPGADMLLTEAGIARRIGDADNDGKLTIKDATYIQKGLADFEGYDKQFYTLVPSVTRYYYEDFDGSGAVDIKDATGIQKYLAGLEYDYRYDSNVRFDAVPVGVNPVEFTTSPIDIYGYGGGKDRNKLITSVAEYKEFFYESSDVYNEEFFEDNVMVYMYRWYPSGSIKLTVQGVYAMDGALYIEYEEIHPNLQTSDIGKFENFIICPKAQTGDIDELVISAHYNMVEVV